MKIHKFPKALSFCLLALAVVSLILLTPTKADAATVASGTCGDNLTWVLDNTGTLTISGTGPMYDYSGSAEPWSSYRTSISVVTVNEGVTSIGGSVFVSYDNLYAVRIPASVTSIGDEAFRFSVWGGFAVSEGNTVYCSVGPVLFNKEKTILLRAPMELSDYVIPEGVTTIAEAAFSRCGTNSVTIPTSVTSIDGTAFESSYVRIVYYKGTQQQWESISIPSYEYELTAATKYYNSCNGAATHSYRWVTDRAATCIAGGVKHEECTGCGEKRSENTKTEPTGNHNIVDGACTLCGLAGGTCGDNLTWVLENGTLTISGNGAMYDYAYDSNSPTYSTHPWKDVAASIKSVEIAPSVTTVGDYAFRYCENLETVTIGDSVTSIGDSAFRNCESLQSVIIGNRVETIGDEAFEYCYSLTSVTIPDSVTSIGKFSFSCCFDLSCVTMGTGVTSVGYWAFYGCRYLTDVYYGGTQTQWSAISFDEENTDLTSANIHYQHIHDYTLFPSVTVEPTCTQNGYTEYTCAFGETFRQPILALGHDYNGAVTVVDPTCLKDGYTLTQCTRCSDTQTTDPVSALGHKYSIFVSQVEPTCLDGGYTTYACSRCDAQKDDDKVSALGHDFSVFVDTVEPTCLEEGYSVYQCVRCEEKQTRDQVPALGHDYSGTVTVVDPTCQAEGYTETQCIRCDSTEKTNYKNIVAHKMAILPAKDPTCTESGLTVGTACKWCGLVGVAQKEVAATGHSYVDHEGKDPTCTEIGWAAYQTCEKCDYTSYAEIMGQHTYVNDVCSVCGEGSKNFSFTVSGGKATITDYTGSGGDITIPSTLGGYPVTGIGGEAFYDCDSLTSVTIPDGVESIGYGAFEECTSLISVTIPDSVVSISTVAFSGCTSLTSVTIPDGVTSITFGVFSECINLTSVTIPDSIISIGDGAFSSCTGLTSVTIPDSVTAIGQDAFSSCTNLTDVYYTGTEAQWKAITLDRRGNDALINANIHYACAHNYAADPTTCGLCGYVRVDAEINKVTLRPSCSGLYFKGSFTFGAEENVARYGIAVSLYNKQPVADDTDPQSLYTIGNTSVLISDIMKRENTEDQNGIYAQEQVYARVYALLSDGTYVYGNVVSVNLAQLCESVDAKWDALTDTQKDSFMGMYDEFAGIMRFWEIPNIREIKGLTYEEYLALTGEEQYEYYTSFLSMSAFNRWHNYARNNYYYRHPEEA